MSSVLTAQKTKSDADLLADAVDRGDLSRVTALLASGADPNEQTRFGLTVLMRSIINGHVNVAELLLEHGADVNARQDHGFTPLLFAAFFGQYDLVCLLLQRGADVKAQSRFETSAEMWASARGFTELAALLRRVSLDGAPAGSFTLEESVKKQTTAVGMTSNERILYPSSPVSYKKSRKRTMPASSGKRIAALTAAAVLISGLCTYYAARTSGERPDRAHDRNGRASFLSSAASAGERLAADQIEHQITLKDVAEFSESHSGLLADKGKQLLRVEPNPAIAMRLPTTLANQEKNQRANVGAEFANPSPTPAQSESNKRMRHVASGAPTRTGKAKGKKSHPDSNGGSIEEMLEIKPAAVMVEEKPFPSNTSDLRKLIESSSPQSPPLPASTDPKHKVIRWP